MQYSSESEMSGLRVSSKAFPPPPLWVDPLRDKTIIDFAGFLYEHSPRDDFEAFQKYWDEEVEPKYYLFLHSLLYGSKNSRSAKVAAVGKLFQSLDNLKTECLEPARKKASTALDAIQKEGESLPKREPKKDNSKPSRFAVLLPPGFENEDVTLEIKSLINYDQCCGQPPFLEEEFVLMTVDCK
jgi:hypothetical protein